MATNILSLFLPPAMGEPSVYETLQQNDESSDQSDVEERAGMTLDEENLGARFHDFELDDALVDASASQVVPSVSGRPYRQGRGMTAQHTLNPSRARQTTHRTSAEDADDDVPQSLLIEGDQEDVPASREHRTRNVPPPVQGSPSRETQARWQATQERQQLHQETLRRQPRSRVSYHQSRIHGVMDPKDRAMWMWTNVENLDNFLRDVYDYFVGNGVWCIMLSRALNLLTTAFVVTFSTFLTTCIDYKQVPQSKTMSDILIPQCTKNMPGTANFLIWVFGFLWICKLFQYCYEFRRLQHMQNFYYYLLGITDTEIQTVSWPEVVRRLMLLRDSNPITAAGVKEKHRRFMGTQSKQRMDAHDIANRLMRRDNYLIALINKEILDLTLPVPFLRNRQLFSKTLEWNLNLCILDYVFNDQGQVRPLFLRDTHRRALSDGLRRRFLFAGFMNFLCAPFIVLFFMLLYFFRYFNEYQRNPSQIGSRQYTPLAEWKFRAFNELWHLFERRINMSYPFASRYLDQFPKEKTVQLSRFVAFVSGALASVMAVASLIDPESLLAFEITRERTVLFYLGVFGTVWAVARGLVPEENLVFDPEYALNNVAEYTHYLPSHWNGRLHSDEVRMEFAQLYKMKLVIFLEEILSIVLAPFILWFSLPKCSDRLVDFFREFTIHVDGLGYVCSFAVFDFRKEGNLARSSGRNGQDLRGDHFSDKDNKMITSYYNFMDNYAVSHRPGAPSMYPPNRQSFHAPPAFPGLMSPTIATDAQGPPSGRQGRAEQLQRGPGRSIMANMSAGHQSSHHRTPRFAPLVGHSSPMASIVLDPQHQPASMAVRSKNRLSSRSRLRASRQPLDDPVEDEEDTLREEGDQSRGDGSAADDGNLDGSWKTTHAGNREEDGDEDAQTHNHDRGVLGLVVQFSRNTEGRGTGVKI